MKSGCAALPLTESEVRERLFLLKDDKYKNFHKRLIPTVEEDRIIGVRTPEIRKYAKELSRRGDIDFKSFFEILPHGYVEENNLHAFLIERVRDYDDAMTLTERFLPFIDNWATCDMFSPEIFKKRPEETLCHVKKWLESDYIYTVRYGIVTLLTMFLDELFEENQLALVAKTAEKSALNGGEYYIDMAAAWYFSAALVKQEKSAMSYIQNERLPVWVHNKAIQKAIESLRITAEKKNYLRGLKKIL